MSVRCQILLFAGVAEAVGAERLELELPDGATAADAVARLAAGHAAIAALRDRLAVAINERYAAPGTALADGDVVALIPPVSGG